MENLLKYQERIILKEIEGRKYIKCIIRKKFLILQPEEIVRQLFLLYLIEEMNYPIEKIAVERGITINGLSRRYDILVFDNKINPWLLVECKSMFIPINQDVMDQVSHYNLPLKAPYFALTNGQKNIYCQLNNDKNKYEFMGKLPPYK